MGWVTKGLRDSLLSGEPITPKHESPTSLTGDYGGVFHSPVRNQFFSDFDMFAEKINSLFVPGDIWEGEPWRLQELSDTRLSRANEPVFGRRYQVFYNQGKIGTAEISSAIDYSADNPVVHE